MFLRKNNLISDDKNFLNDLFENLTFERTILATEVKKLLKVLAIGARSLMCFSSLVINEGVSLFFGFINTKVFIPFQVVRLLS